MCIALQALATTPNARKTRQTISNGSGSYKASQNYNIIIADGNPAFSYTEVVPVIPYW
jgi:hypothetical protein